MSVAKVTDGPALGVMVSQFFDEFQKKKKKNYNKNFKYEERPEGVLAMHNIR